jgi:hypothetical protein
MIINIYVCSEGFNHIENRFLVGVLDFLLDKIYLQIYYFYIYFCNIKVH